jgi:hypothetical protein
MIGVKARQFIEHEPLPISRLLLPACLGIFINEPVERVSHEHAAVGRRGVAMSDQDTLDWPIKYLSKRCACK